MVQNFPGPYELRLSYVVTITGVPLTHTARLNVDLTSAPTVGDAFNNINAKTRGGIATPDLAAVIEAWLELVKMIYKTTTTFGIVELWKYEPLSFDASFVSAYTPTISAGVDTDPTNTAGQEILTFRTQEGGILRLNFMETVFLTYGVQPYPIGAVRYDDIFEFVISSVNWVLARDTSYPFATLNRNMGQNEKTFRQRFR